MTVRTAEESAPLERVLVLVDGARNALITVRLLEHAGVEAFVCSAGAELAREIERGAGAALVGEEMLTRSTVDSVAAVLRRQPAWSDLPVVVFGSGEVSASLEERARMLGNVTFLDRPVRARSLTAAVRAAIRSRRRQYDARREIESRDTFLAMLGHELRNPLGAIRLAVNALSKDEEALVDKATAIVDRQSAHLERLVDDLLDVARVTHGKIAIDRKRLDVAETLRAAFETTQPRATERGLGYELVRNDGPIWIDGDRQRLEQVFVNLLGNAVKYTPSGGAVAVSLRREGEEAVIEIRDNGVGIAPELLDRVFDAFAQAERSLDRTEGGLGLGLSVVRSLVQLHGGSVSAASEGVGKGSVFTVRLPAVDAAAVAAVSSSRDLSARSKRRVVIVDDNEDIRELMTELLRDDGHDVASAADGPEGLKVILEQAPEIAFVDIGLPGFDGLEVARRLRSAGCGARLVAVTGYGQAEDRLRAVAAGFDHHLTKPVAERDLFRVMELLGK